jgi:superfamily I DNA/RNA helicase
MNAQAFRRFDWRRPSVKLLTLHSAKGLEFPLVFVAGLQALPMAGETLDDALRLLYVAMTRATRELVLSAHGASPVVQRVRESLGEVARHFGCAAGDPPR